jgi:ABC-type bacteriocin/lantibiotic exporter with double-glycine peptidase domain
MINKLICLLAKKRLEHVDVGSFIQEAEYSCGAACLQMICHNWGATISHSRAIELTRCNPDGCEATCILRALNKVFKCRFFLKKIKNPKIWIKKNHPVLVADSVYSTKDHFKILFGHFFVDFLSFYLVADPTSSKNYCEIEKEIVKKSGKEMYVFLPRH